MRAQSQRSGWRYYRESSRFSGIDCADDGRGVRAEEVETVIFERNQILAVRPKPEYDVLFQFVNALVKETDGLYYFR